MAQKMCSSSTGQHDVALPGVWGLPIRVQARAVRAVPSASSGT